MYCTHVAVKWMCQTFDVPKNIFKFSVELETHVSQWWRTEHAGDFYEQLLKDRRNKHFIRLFLLLWDRKKY